jgi:hypothetical protein
MILNKEFSKYYGNFEYKNGNLYYKVDLSKKMKTGKKAGSIASDGRYYNIGINKKGYRLHRIIYLYHFGHLPAEIDHIDGNRLNNLIENLRPATRSQNACNAKKSAANSSGVKGVRWNKKDKKWRACIRINRKEYFGGNFDSVEQAAQKVKQMRQYFHGEFARDA